MLFYQGNRRVTNTGCDYTSPENNTRVKTHKSWTRMSAHMHRETLRDKGLEKAMLLSSPGYPGRADCQPTTNYRLLTPRATLPNQSAEPSACKQALSSRSYQKSGGLGSRENRLPLPPMTVTERLIRSK